MSTTLHFGLILALTIRGLAVTSYETMRRVASQAEELGFDSIWLCDHFLTLAPDAYGEDAGIAAGAGPGPRAEEPRSMPLLECWTALSALARDTRRLRLGTSVLCHSYRSPAVLAKMAATLDVISGGRLDLGLGAGWFEQVLRLAYQCPNLHVDTSGTNNWLDSYVPRMTLSDVFDVSLTALGPKRVLFGTDSGTTAPYRTWIKFQQMRVMEELGLSEGDRVGVGWIYSSCGRCRHCREVDHAPEPDKIPDQFLLGGCRFSRLSLFEHHPSHCPRLH